MAAHRSQIIPRVGRFDIRGLNVRNGLPFANGRLIIFFKTITYMISLQYRSIFELNEIQDSRLTVLYSLCSSCRYTLFYGVVKLKTVDQAEGPLAPLTLTRQ